MENTEKMLKDVRRLFDEVYTKADLAPLPELFASNVKLNDPALKGPKSGLEALTEVEETYKTAFPHKKIRIDEIFAAADKVVVRWTCQGKQEGEYLGHPATNRPFTVTGISVYKFAGGKIAEVHQNWDRLTLLEQIGALPAAHALR